MNCKLTDQNLQTHKGFQWVLGRKEVIETVGGELCSSDFFHYYSSPLLAVLLNQIHADIQDPRLFTVAVDGEIKSDNGLKFGAKEMELIDELELPVVTKEQHIAFGILCALEVSKVPTWINWATGWLDGTDRSKESAYAAYMDVANASYAATLAAYVAYVAVANTSYAAAYAATQVAAAAKYATKVDVDLIGIAEKAMEY